MLDLEKDVDYILVNSQFPHIGVKLKAIWGYPEFYQYVNKLMNDTRDGHRQGFPLEVASGLFRLYNKHDTEFPQWIPKGDKWEFR